MTDVEMLEAEVKKLLGPKKIPSGRIRAACQTVLKNMRPPAMNGFNLSALARQVHHDLTADQ